MAFRTSHGRQLVFRRGSACVEVQYTEILPGIATTHERSWRASQVLEAPAIHNDEDVVRCRLRVTEREGETYLGERLVSANRFIELLRIPHLTGRRPKARLLHSRV